VVSEHFSSDETKRLVGQLSGQNCSGSTSFWASWYQPGDHSLPHNDRVISDRLNEVRNVAFVWHLSKDWRPEWVAPCIGVQSSATCHHRSSSRAPTSNSCNASWK
jgi:Rps23 Pro-64 3,4-dihydroxylase Tpa1-like proline 4-hydroxylase